MFAIISLALKNWIFRLREEWSPIWKKFAANHLLKLKNCGFIQFFLVLRNSKLFQMYLDSRSNKWVLILYLVIIEKTCLGLHHFGRHYFDSPSKALRILEKSSITA